MFSPMRQLRMTNMIAFSPFSLTVVVPMEALEYHRLKWTFQHYPDMELAEPTENPSCLSFFVVKFSLWVPLSLPLEWNLPTKQDSVTQAIICDLNGLQDQPVIDLLKKDRIPWLGDEDRRSCGPISPPGSINYFVIAWFIRFSRHDMIWPRAAHPKNSFSGIFLISAEVSI
jgi:hypothetical protein